MLPLVMGTAKFFWAEAFDEPLAGGGGGDAAPFTGCGSTSIELEFMAELDMADSRLRSRSSGGRFNGWVSGSYLLRREWPASVECRERRDLDVDDDDLVVSLWWWETGRAGFLVGDEDEGAALGLWGMSLSSTLEVEGLFLEALLPLKNFMRAAALESWGEGKRLSRHKVMPDIWNRREVYRGLGNKRAFKNPVVLGRGGGLFFFLSFFGATGCSCTVGKRGSSDFLGKKGRGWLARGGGIAKDARRSRLRRKGPRFISLRCRGLPVKLVSSQARQVPGMK